MHRRGAGEAAKDRIVEWAIGCCDGLAVRSRETPQVCESATSLTYQDIDGRQLPDRHLRC
jgi:hypothetical protein